MASKSYEEAADHFDREHIPGDYLAEQEIRDYLNERFRDTTVPKTLKDEIAERVSDKRARREPPEDDPNSDYHYDPNTGMFRDSETGHFVGGGGE